MKNLIPQPIGTEDGTTPHSDGVRVFFPSAPTVTQGTGLVTVSNKDGNDSFTGGFEPYFRYAAVLDSGEVSSARRWRLSFTPLVQAFTFHLGVSAAVPLPDGWVDVTPLADTVEAGDSQAFTARVRDAYGATVPGASVTWASSAPAVATVAANGVVTGVAAGTASITATSSPRAGSATVTVAQTTCPLPAVGEVHVPSGSGAICLRGGTSGAEYVVVPVNASPSAAVPLSVTATGIVPVSSLSPLPSSAGAAFSRASATEGWEPRLRRLERSALAGRMAAARSAFRARKTGARRAVVPGVPTVGDLMTLNVKTGDLCTAPDLRTGRVVAVGTRAIVLADTANPAGGLSTGYHQGIASLFADLVWPTVTGDFGEPEDIDGNGRVIAFFTRAVNELTPPGAAPVTDGFTLRRDLYDGTTCAASNVGEVIFLAAADPSGAVNGNPRTVHSVRSTAGRTLGHELAHLVNASRRIYVSFATGFEETWLDEGLAQVAEERLFYQASLEQPRQNLDQGDFPGAESVFMTYAAPNFSRLRAWLLAPHASGFFQKDEDLATRGAAWAFLRYAADRRGGTESTFWHALANSTDSGMVNLEAAIGTGANPWIRDFAVATYADDAQIGADAAYTQPSWGFRDLFSALDLEVEDEGFTFTGRPGGGGGLEEGCVGFCGGPASPYPLLVRTPANGTATTFTLANGGAAAYLRVRVPAGGNATVTIQSSGGAPPATVLVAVVRRQ